VHQLVNKTLMAVSRIFSGIVERKKKSMLLAWSIMTSQLIKKQGNPRLF